MKSTTKKLLVFSLVFLLLPFATHALTNPLGNVTSIQGLIGRLIKVLLGLAGSFSLLMFVWGGFQYLWSGGDPAKIKKGKDTIINAVLGIFIILFAYTFVTAIINALATGTV
jgi:hypothetical protein